MTEAIAAVLTLGFTAFVLVYVPYAKGGREALRANARPLLLLFLGCVVVVILLGSLYASGILT